MVYTRTTAPGCKRLLLDAGYLHALGQPNVSVKFGGAARITSKGVETMQGAFCIVHLCFMKAKLTFGRNLAGDEIPVDILIFATGFSVVCSSPSPN